MSTNFRKEFYHSSFSGKRYDKSLVETYLRDNSMIVLNNTTSL